MASVFYVQYEVEYDDRLSHNGIVEVKARDGLTAMKAFNKNHHVINMIAKDYPDAISISANAAWPKFNEVIDNG